MQDAERLREELAEVGRERDGLRLKVEVLERRSEGVDTEGTAAAPSSGGFKFAEYLSERKAYEAEVRSCESQRLVPSFSFTNLVCDLDLINVH